jgi:hypothetical protein
MEADEEDDVDSDEDESGWETASDDEGTAAARGSHEASPSQVRGLPCPDVASRPEQQSGVHTNSWFSTSQTPGPLSFVAGTYRREEAMRAVSRERVMNFAFLDDSESMLPLWLTAETFCSEVTWLTATICMYSSMTQKSQAVRIWEHLKAPLSMLHALYSQNAFTPVVALQMEDDAEEWDVRRSLFDNHMSESMQANLEYMWKKFGFYFPEADLLSDPEGLLRYLVGGPLTRVPSQHTCIGWHASGQQITP